MADVLVTNNREITQYEVRATAMNAFNNLNVSVDDPLNKYHFVIQRVAEPQDAQRVQVGGRIALQPRTLGIMDVANEIYRAGGLEATGLQILALVNAVIDKHKGDGITPDVIANS